MFLLVLLILFLVLFLGFFRFSLVNGRFISSLNQVFARRFGSVGSPGRSAQPRDESKQKDVCQFFHNSECVIMFVINPRRFTLPKVTNLKSKFRNGAEK